MRVRGDVHPPVIGDLLRCVAQLPKSSGVGHSRSAVTLYSYGLRREREGFHKVWKPGSGGVVSLMASPFRRVCVGGKKAAILAAGVKVGSPGHLPARVLPDLAAVVPMETKLRKNRGYLAGLLSFKLNPNPLAYHLGDSSKKPGLPSE